MLALEVEVALVEAGADGVGVGAPAGLVPAVSEEAGVFFVLSVPDAAGCSDDSFSEPGFILSE